MAAAAVPAKTQIVVLKYADLVAGNNLTAEVEQAFGCVIDALHLHIILTQQTCLFIIPLLIFNKTTASMACTTLI